MENYELLLTTQGEENISETIECLNMAVNDIVLASENDFNTLKSKKWYTRLWEVITFSKDNQKIQARGVANLAKLTEIVMKAVVLVSKQSANTSALLSQTIKKIEGNLEKIEVLTNNQIKITNIIKELKWGYKKRLTIGDLTSDKKTKMSAIMFKYARGLNDDIVSNATAQRILILIYDDSAPTDVNYSILDSFDENETVLLYRLIQSYHYVATNEFDDESELLDFLRISRKDEKNVKADIQDTIKFLGSEYYIDSLTENFDYRLIEVDMLEWEETSDVADEEQTLDFIMFEDMTISSMIHIAANETLEYKNKNIKIESLIQCSGTLVFESCNIIYNVSKDPLSTLTNSATNKKSEIILKGTATFIAKNCTFVCERKTEKVFINSSNGDSSVTFENCKFKDCTYFVGDYVKEFLLVNSEISNCADSFVKLYFYNDEAKCRVEGNAITNDKLSTFNMPNDKYDSITLFYIHQGFDTDMELSISNNSIVQKREFKESPEDLAYTYLNDIKITYFNIDNGTISKCTFNGAEHCVAGALNVEECIFRNCTKPVESIENQKYRANIKKCLFRNCTESITAKPDTTISNCKFLGCKGTVINGLYAWNGGVIVEFCEFLNHINTSDSFRDASIILNRSKKSSSKSNDVKNCVFDGCVLGANYLVASNCHEKPYNKVVYVENCEFRNCKTKRKDKRVIRENDSYYGFLDTVNEFKAISVYDCTGLDNVNLEGSSCDRAVKESALALAEKIGANIEK